MAILIMAFSFASCGGSGSDSEPTQLSVDVTNIMLPSTANSSQVIHITCNSSWNISGIADWLQISSLSGNGNSSIVITTRTANESSSVRTANLIVSSQDQAQTITIQQEAALSSCRVVPSNITSLYYAVIFNLTYSSEVATTKILLLSDYDYKHLTETEIINSIEKEESQIPEDETIFTRATDSDTNYHILCLAYDKKGNRGELVDVEFKSPKYQDATDDAWCSIADAAYNSSEFWFDVTKQGRCANYDVIYGANLPTNYLRGTLMAFEINYFIKNGKKNWLSENWRLNIETNYPNNHTFYCNLNTSYSYGGIIATTWGIFADGTRSSDITTVSGDIYSSESMSLNGEKNSISEIEWIRSQKGFIKTSMQDFEKVSQ